MPQGLTPQVIEAAIAGFEQQKTKLQEQIEELRALLPSRHNETAATSETAPRRRKFSAAARRKMAESQRARWQRIRGESEPSAPAAETKKPKRKLSAEGRANIVAALKKRHAAAKKAGTSATAKDTAPARKKSATKKAVTKGSRTKAATKAPAAALSTQAAG
jgi:hypothetical protein